MTKLYNRTSDKAKRQQLRRNMTKAEFMLWQKLKGRKLKGVKFRSQYSVGQFVVDFYCTELKLAIEIDGESHFQDGAQEYDWERQAFIESVGIRFLRFTNNHVYGNLEGVLEKILQKIGELRDNPPQPPLLRGEPEFYSPD
jgi:very-short-patch-repair endonuclease